MAIGSGMLYGKGLFNDTAISVKNGNYLSEEHTDFIFSVIGEELGFVGCMVVLLLYLLFVYECLRMADTSGVVTTKARSAPAMAFLKPCSIPAVSSKCWLWDGL